MSIEPAGQQQFRQKKDASGQLLFEGDGKPMLEPVPAPNPKAARQGAIGCLAILGVILAIVIAIVVFSDPSDNSSSGADTAKFDQTWAKSYGVTTCDEWVNAMSDKQRFVGAADIITALRSTSALVEENEYLPADSMIRDYQDQITGTCVLSPTSTVAETGAVVFRINSTFSS